VASGRPSRRTTPSGLGRPPIPEEATAARDEVREISKLSKPLAERIKEADAEKLRIRPHTG
jgi:hypothetical protein